MGYIGFPRHEFSQWSGYVNKNDFNHMRGFKKWGSPKNGEFDHEKTDLTINNRDLTMKETEWTNKNRGFWCNPRFSRTKGPHFWLDRALFYWENTGMPEANCISTFLAKKSQRSSKPWEFPVSHIYWAHLQLIQVCFLFFFSGTHVNLASCGY